MAYHIIEYVKDCYEYNSPESIPGPWIAKLSDVWLARKAALGNRSGEVHHLHQKYGTFFFPFLSRFIPYFAHFLCSSLFRTPILPICLPMLLVLRCVLMTLSRMGTDP